MRAATGFRHLLHLAALSAAAGLGSAPALAQAETQVAAAAAPAPAEEAIIVTATKRETELQDTPISIAVIGDQAIEDRHVEALLDLANGAVPSLRITTFEARQEALTVGIRGIVPNDANQPAREQGVGVYLDGVYLGRQHGLNAALLDIERIEVLRGPQGTLFGRNTEGGAVSLITRAPSGEFGLRATAGIGNFGSYNVNGHLDFPEFQNVSVKLDGVVQFREPLTADPLPGSTGWAYYDRRGLRLSALWRPREDFSARYSFDTGWEGNTPFFSQLVNYNPNNLPIATTFPIPPGTIAPLPPIVGVHPERQDIADVGVPQQPSTDRTFGHALHLDWDVLPDLTLRSITAYREVLVDQWDNAGGPERVPAFSPNGAFSRYSLANFDALQWSQEVQAVGSWQDRLDYVVGVHYFDEKVSDDAATPNSNQWNADGTAYSIRDPLTFPGSAPGVRSIDRASVAYSQSVGVFAHGVYTPPILDDALHLTVGGRFTHDEKNGRLHTVNNAPTNFTFDIDEDRFDPVVTLAYDISPEVNVYATYATGYRAGGASSRSLIYRSFGPEEVESWEIGAKTQFDRVTLNLALFDMDRTNSQFDFTLITPDPVTGANRNTVETVNAPGTTEIRGIELDGQAAVTDDLTLTLAYAYTDTNVPPAVNPFTGIPQQVFIIYTPFNVINAGLDYVYPLGFADLRLHLDASYADGTQSFEQFALKTDDSFVVNGRLALADVDVGEGRGVTFALWARNLFDEEHIYRRSAENRATLGDYANFNEPRTYGAEISVQF